jgi:hypothetical protein
MTACKITCELRRYLVEKQLGQDDSFLWVRDAFFNASPENWEGNAWWCMGIHPY